MGQNFSLDINKQPFYLAGQKVDALTFVVGEQWLKISLCNCPVKDGSVVVRLLPEQARTIAREMLASADKDQVKRIMKQAHDAAAGEHNA